MFFESRVSQLRAARQLAASFQEKVDVSHDVWRAANKEKILRADVAKQDLKEIESSLRADIVGHYKETGNKKPHLKLGVRVSEVPIYAVEDAVGFAFKTIPTLLKLDTLAFKSYARGVRASAPLSFVEWEEKVTATIAKDLEE